MMRLNVVTVLVLALVTGELLAQQAVPFQPRIIVRNRINAQATVPPQDDDAILRLAGLKPDDLPGIQDYYRKRTLSETELKRIQAVIQRMGDENFEVRRKASEEALSFGPGAIYALRQAAQSETDYEMAFRATETLTRLEEKVSHAQVAIAGARMLAKSGNRDAIAPLIGFLPMSDNSAVEEEIRQTIITLAQKPGPLAPGLVEALGDSQPLRRTVASVALIAAANADPKSPAVGQLSKIREVLKKEEDLDSSFRISMALATMARDSFGVSQLIELLPRLSEQRGRVWQIEDVLLQLAGDKAPKIALKGEISSLTDAKIQWRTFWDENQAKINLKDWNYSERTSGRMMVMVMDNLNYGQGRLMQLGPDMKPEWTVQGITSPADFQQSADGKIWILEQNNYRITERDREGRILQTYQASQGPPMAFHLRDNGHLVVAYQTSLMELDTKNALREIPGSLRQIPGIRAIDSRGNGPVYILSNDAGGGLIQRLDEKGQLMKGKVQRTGPLSAVRPKIEVLEGDRVLVTEKDRIVEYDFNKEQKPGEGSWSFTITNATSVQRLANGNTLVVDTAMNKIREIAPDKTEVWHRPQMERLRYLSVERR